MKQTTLIQPAEVNRDEDGYWFHPDVPTFAGTDEADEDSPVFKDWIREQGLESYTEFLEHEPEDHPAYVRYYDHEDTNISNWNPESPEGDGWFLLGISDTEDGPCAWFVRRSVPTTDAGEEG